MLHIAKSVQNFTNDANPALPLGIVSRPMPSSEGLKARQAIAWGNAQPWSEDAKNPEGVFSNSVGQRPTNRITRFTT
jgi:hypothetical protein